MIKLLKNEFGERWKESTIVADFWGEIKNKLELKLKEEKSLPIKVLFKESWHTTWWGKIIIGAIVGFISIWLGYLFISS